MKDEQKDKWRMKDEQMNEWRMNKWMTTTMKNEGKEFHCNSVDILVQNRETKKKLIFSKEILF